MLFGGPDSLDSGLPRLSPFRAFENGNLQLSYCFLAIRLPVALIERLTMPLSVDTNGAKYGTGCSLTMTGLKY